MGLKLVRKSSSTQFVTNKDDATMIRHAYGGYNGVVKSYRDECSYTAENGVFKILGGRIVLDGWETDIDELGWSLNLSTVSATQYHVVYLELNISVESAEIKSTYATEAYPAVSLGDDLTAIPNGTARILLYTVKVQTGSIVEVTKKFDVINTLLDRIGNNIVPLKKLIFQGKAQPSSDESFPEIIFTHTESLLGKTLEIEFSNLDEEQNPDRSQYAKSKITNNTREGYNPRFNTIFSDTFWGGNYGKGSTIICSRIRVAIDPEDNKTLLAVAYTSYIKAAGGNELSNAYLTETTEGWAKYITRVWEIIE